MGGMRVAELGNMQHALPWQTVICMHLRTWDLTSRWPPMLAHVTYAAQQWHHVQALVDTHIHASARGVLEALARHDCGPALAWCEANRPRLRKQKSKLEFKLRVQARPLLDPLVLKIIAVLSLVCT